MASSGVSETRRGGKNWFQQCVNMISYSGGGISSPQAKSMLSPIWKRGIEHRLEGDDLCRWALKEVQPELDLYLSERQLPSRQVKYSPTGIYQQYGLFPGEKQTFWRYNPIQGYPPLLEEDYPQIILDENFYIPSQSTDKPPRSKFDPKSLVGSRPKPRKPVVIVPRVVPPVPVFVQPRKGVTPQILSGLPKPKSNAMRAPPKIVGFCGVGLPPPPPPIVGTVDIDFLPQLDFIPPPEEEFELVEPLSRLTLSRPRPILRPARQPIPARQPVPARQPILIRPPALRGAGARPSPIPTRFNY